MVHSWNVFASANHFPVLTCHCGGGTIDIITYIIESTLPNLKFRELAPGLGGKMGSIAIDREFLRWLSRTFGAAFDKPPAAMKAPGSDLMDAFERKKRQFGSEFASGSRKSRRACLIGLSMAGVKKNMNYNKAQQKVSFTE